MPQLSVIIPCYNGEKYISQAIQSVLDSTHQDFEIIVTNDGSTDGSVSRIEAFDDSRILLFNFDRNRGVAAATNNCIEQARGKYVAILDADNVYLSSKLETQIQFLENHPEIGAVFTWVELIDDSGRKLEDTGHPYHTLFEQPNRTRQEWLSQFFYRNNFLCHPTAMIRKECYETVGHYDTRLSQLLDFDLWIRLCRHYEIFIIPEELLKFRIHDDDSNLSGQSLGAQSRHDWQAGQILNNYLEISSTDELLEIFPEVSRFGPQLDGELVPYYLSMLAFDGDYASAKLWALNTLYAMLGNPAAKKKLREAVGFEEIDLIRMTSDPDVFDLARRVRLQRIQLHEQERIGHEQTHLIQQQQRKIESMERSWSWKLTGPLRGIQEQWRSLSRGKRSIQNIRLECDRMSYSSRSIDLSGWALSEKGIDRVEVHLDGMFLANADYGIAREDIQEAYPSIEGSLHSGFHLHLELSGLASSDVPKQKAVIRAYDGRGEYRELSMVLQ